VPCLHRSCRKPVFREVRFSVVRDEPDCDCVRKPTRPVILRKPERKVHHKGKVGDHKRKRFLALTLLARRMFKKQGTEEPQGALRTSTKTKPAVWIMRIVGSYLVLLWSVFFLIGVKGTIEGKYVPSRAIPAVAHFYCSLLGSLDGAYTARFKRKSKANACVKPRGWCASAGGPPVKSPFRPSSRWAISGPGVLAAIPFSCTTTLLNSATRC
jgi:hypothetical protein